MDDDLTIPAFLRRKPGEVPRDVTEQVAALIGSYHRDREEGRVEGLRRERKRLKSLARIAKMKAKKSGELSRMPASGKAALALINRS